MQAGHLGPIAAVILLASQTTPTRADVLRFAEGGRAELPTEMRGPLVVLKAPGGDVAFVRQDFRAILAVPTPLEEWPERKRHAEQGGAPGRFEAAWWALGNGLTTEATAMLREAHASDPDHEPTARMVAALDRLESPRPDPALDALRRNLGGSFEIARGPHVVVFHQHDPVEAAERVDLLERVTATFFLTMAARGIDLPVPPKRLASAYFARQEDYLASLKADGGIAFRTTRGYYHPTRRLVLAYDAREGDPQRPAREAIAQARRRLSAAEGRTTQERPRRDLARLELLFDLDCRAIDVSTAAHEMIHQLIAATGLSPRPDAFPIWLHEGLAAQFEVVRGGVWAGVGQANDFRLPFWRKIDPPPRLLAVVGDVGFGHGYHPDRYAEAWALVHYLRASHPREFVAYLDLLRAPDSEPADRPARGVAAFRAAFGDDFDALESDWRRATDALRLPGEPAPAD